ncbi:MAG TPA: endonuclease domain-containing protein [Longimicrobium sp.]|nr:endonuclease domain-containing protein [Longimicrobium sp.]
MRASRQIREAAKALRKEMTTEERVLWNAIRGWKLGDGAKFRRQHPMGRFVLDFYCPAHKLCVEVDGGIHATQQDRDEARDAALQAQGIRTLRFRNEEVVKETESVLRRIEAEMR